MRIKLLSLCFAFIATACSCVAIMQSVNGDGDVVKINREITNFDHIKAEMGLTVYLIPDEKEYIVVEADSNLHAEILTVLDGNTLRIYSQKSIRSAKAKNIHVHYVSLKRIDSSSGAFVQSTSAIESSDIQLSASSGSRQEIEVIATNVKVSASSGSRQEVEITADNVNADVSSGASISAKGKSKFADLQASSGASFRGDFKTDACTANVSSGASIHFEVITKLQAKASSGGSIRYSGKPTDTSVNTSSGGSIRTMN